MNMPEGIKLSDQLYPATGDKILSQAEYIHDSLWKGEYKDLQSINQLLNTQDVLLDDKIEGYKNDLTINAGSGLIKTENVIGSTISICDTIYAYLENNNPERYPGVVKGAVRGDVNNDGKVSINDATFLINTLLSNKQNNTVEILLLHSDNNYFNNLKSTLNIPQAQSVYAYVINITDYNIGTTTVSTDNTPLEKSVLICDKALSRDSEGEDEISFTANVIGYKTLESSDPILIENQNIEPITFIDDNGTISIVINTDDEQEVDIIINDPNRILTAISIDGSDRLNISQVTTLINYLLSNNWDNSNFYANYVLDSIRLYSNPQGNSLQGTPILTYPGIIYLAILDTTGKIYYYIGTQDNDNVLYPIKITTDNINIQDLKDWLQSALLIDPANNSISLNTIGDPSIQDADTNSRITASFIKYSDTDIMNAIQAMDQSEDISSFVELFGLVNEGGLRLTINKLVTNNPIVKIPIYLWDISNAEIVNTQNSIDPSISIDLLLYHNLFDNIRIKVELSDNSKVKLVNNLGEEVDYIIFDNINNLYPFILLNLKYKLPELGDNNSIVLTSVRLVELSSVDDTVFHPLGSVLDVNCTIPNINQ